MKAKVHDSRICSLGEGVLWHPLRKQLFWFDINNRKLLSQKNGKTLEWQFDRYVSAAGWIDEKSLLIATDSNLISFTLNNSNQVEICPLEDDKPLTRSNDGRADPWGGFWIGTMGKKAELNTGSIYRFYHGEVRQLVSALTIPNAICFSPDKHFAYYTDTKQRKIWRQTLHVDTGWPEGNAVLYLDLNDESLNPDGAVIDENGNLWNAQWGASRVACYSPEGNLIDSIEVGASQPSCPGFGGHELNELFITTATENLDFKALMTQSDSGKTFVCRTIIKGQEEHQVKL